MGIKQNRRRVSILYKRQLNRQRTKEHPSLWWQRIIGDVSVALSAASRTPTSVCVCVRARALCYRYSHLTSSPVAASCPILGGLRGCLPIRLSGGWASYLFQTSLTWVQAARHRPTYFLNVVGAPPTGYVKKKKKSSFVVFIFFLLAG